MHKYMRAIGFSKITDRKELQRLITDVIIEGTESVHPLLNDKSKSLSGA